MPHAVIGPGAHVLGIGRERGLVPVFGVVIALQLAAGEAEEIGDVRMSVAVETTQGGNTTGIVLLLHDQRMRGLITVAKQKLGALLHLPDLRGFALLALDYNG